MLNTEVIIVGGGVAGISCARALQERGRDFLLLEGSDSLGGRVKSDRVNNFILDRGFQVFNSSYSKTLALLGELTPQFNSFYSGALIKTDTGLHALCDPLREPRYALKTLISPIGTVLDKLRMLLLRIDSLSAKPFSSESILEELVSRGFSRSIIEQFFRPFLGGIFLESELTTSSQAFKNVFSGFSQGLAQLPNGGMGEISRRLALPLPNELVLLGRKVVKLSAGQVTLGDGEIISGKQIVLALDVDSLKTLLPSLALPKSRTVYCFYFESNPIPEIRRILALNGSGRGFINNVAMLSSVSSSYAPIGTELLSVSVLSSSSVPELPSAAEIRKEVSEWFPGSEPRFIASYIIQGALPDQIDQATILLTNLKLPAGVLLCGDIIGMTKYHSASIESAVRSGLDLGGAL